MARAAVFWSSLLTFAITVPVVVVMMGLASFACSQSSTKLEKSAVALPRGIYVESVSRNSEGERAGVQAGDLLLDWHRGDLKGEIESPFDLPYLRFEQASRGKVIIGGFHANRRRIWRLGSDVWGIASRPSLPDPLLSMHHQGTELLATGKPIEAAGRWQTAAVQAKQYGVPWLGPWLLSRAASALFDADHEEASDNAYRQAILDADNAGPTVKAELLRQRAAAFWFRHDLTKTEECYHEALLEWQKLGNDTMAVSNALFQIADVDLSLGKLDEADKFLTRAAALAERLAPTSYQATLIRADLGVLSEDRGELDKAEQHYLKALANEQKYFPDSLYLAHTLTAVGTLTHQQGDFASAETYYRRALTTAKKLNANSLDVAEILSDLAECLLEENKPLMAEQYQQQALSIRAKVAPASLSNAFSLAGLGKIARMRGDLIEAEEYYRQALTMVARINAPERESARLMIGEAEVLRDRHDFLKAEELYRQALGIIEKVAPRSMDYGETLADLAGTVRAEGKLDAAAQLYQQALGVLDEKAVHLADLTEQRSRYRARQARYYQEYVDVLVQRGRPDAAFQVVEGSRARTLFEMLTQAHVDVAQKADPALRERERRLREVLNAKSQYRLRLAGSTDADRLADVNTEIADLLVQYQHAETQLRAESPDYAALAEPHPLTVAEIQNLLDADTLLLEYSLGEERSYVWAVTPNLLAAYELPTRSRIEKAARCVHDLVTFSNRGARPGKTPDLARVDREYSVAAQRLSQMVLGPVAGLLPRKRLLIVSEGALQYVSFAALPAPGRATNAAPLVVKHEIVYLPSASVLAELRRQRIGRPKASRMVAVLADPVFDAKDERLKAGTSASSALRSSGYPLDLTRSASDLGLTKNGRVYLSRLLYTRNEAEAVMAVTAPGKGVEALDFRANRTVATSRALAQYRIVHFATHGILNNKHPELSGLVLSLVNEQGKAQNGFLKLQDIYNLKLPVDLVVLSGCETGLGEEIRGEGLIGLTRGFMYAGASRVVASLWSVSDMATATLMADFYRAMEHEGMTPAAALRVAQIRMWRQKQWSSPYYWAAFQIQGEWQ